MAAVKLDTVVDESRKNMADSATRPPARLCSRDGKLCYYGLLEYDFLAFVLLPTSLIFSFLIAVCFSSSCSFVCAAVICYSPAGRINSTCSFLLVVSFVSCLISEFLRFYMFRIFCSSYIWGGVFVVLSYPVR